jgi:hypothetical protein
MKRKIKDKHKEALINVINIPKGRENIQGNSSPFKQTFNAKPSGYDMLDKNLYSRMTEQQLLNLANNIISPDASLETFQSKYKKNDRYKEEIVRVCEEDMKKDFKLKKSIESLRRSKETSNYLNTDSAVNSSKAVPSNVKKAIEYYNQLNN